MYMSFLKSVQHDVGQKMSNLETQMSNLYTQDEYTPQHPHLLAQNYHSDGEYPYSSEDELDYHSDSDISHFEPAENSARGIGNKLYKHRGKFFNKEKMARQRRHYRNFGKSKPHMITFSGKRGGAKRKHEKAKRAQRERRKREFKRQREKEERLRIKRERQEERRRYKEKQDDFNRQKKEKEQRKKDDKQRKKDDKQRRKDDKQRRKDEKHHHDDADEKKHLGRFGDRFKGWRKKSHVGDDEKKHLGRFGDRFKGWRKKSHERTHSDYERTHSGISDKMRSWAGRAKERVRLNSEKPISEWPPEVMEALVKKIHEYEHKHPNQESKKVQSAQSHTKRTIAKKMGGLGLGGLTKIKSKLGVQTSKKTSAPEEPESLKCLPESKIKNNIPIYMH